jgi:Protein kinase domain
MVCFVASKVCEGLDYAHRKKDGSGRPLAIIHRDISPQNVLVSYEGEVKLIDFGIAKAAIRSSRTQAGILKGKFGYMSPEQVRGLPLDRRSDLFAIGTMLYESLTGDRLFASDSDFSTLERVRNAEVEAPSRKNPKIPPELDRIVLRALAKSVDDRYQWANELQDDLHQLLVKLGTPYSPKQLASWMKEAFEQELGRERLKLEAYKKIAQDGPIPDEFEGNDATLIGAPTFEDMVGNQSQSGFGEEGPTEIYGEAAPHDLRLGGGNGAAPTVNETGRPKGAPPVMPSLIPSEPSIQVTETLPERAPGAPPPLPLKGPPSAPAMKGPEAQAPAPAIGSNPGTYVGEPSIRSRAPVKRPGTLLRDVGIGAGAAVLLAAMVAGAYFLGTRVLGHRTARPAPAAVAPTGIVVVTAADGGDGEVFIGGELRGQIHGGEPLKIERLAAGPVEVRCKRPGVRDFVESKSVDPNLPQVVTCRFIATGTLVLTVLTPGATVLLDKKEISSAAALEPLDLAADTAHEITVKKDGFEPQTLTMTVKPGETRAERVELQAVPPPPPPPPAQHGRRPRDRDPGAAATAAPVPPVASGPAVEEEGEGYLTADTTPWAHVLVDGADTNKMTPIAARSRISLPAGKHLVTFVVGEQKFSYTIMVTPGQDYHLSKELPVKSEN